MSADVREAEAVDLSSEALLLLAAENLKKSIEFAVGQLKAKKVKGEMKLKWSCSLVRQVEALVKVVEALNKIGSKSEADLDLSSYLAVLEEKIPRRFVSKRFATVVKTVQARIAGRKPLKV
ncbi:hypothetical protein KEJ24_02165 [Candidatus Bathyarchaeota archaeon]|nr:hypothetical protein [Candidatus Bathyarchaeota archaeon]